MQELSGKLFHEFLAEGCRWIRRRIGVLQRFAVTGPVKWRAAWPHTGRAGSRDSDGTDLSLRLARERLIHPARYPIHHSAGRHRPSQERAGIRCPVRHQLLSNLHEHVMRGTPNFEPPSTAEVRSVALNNATGYCYREWNNKAAEFVTYGGHAGGGRAKRRKLGVVMKRAV
jgi:hypothetical protein